MSACFSFHVRLLVITLSSLKLHNENKVMFTLHCARHRAVCEQSMCSITATPDDIVRHRPTSAVWTQLNTRLLCASVSCWARLFLQQLETQIFVNNTRNWWWSMDPLPRASREISLTVRWLWGLSSWFSNSDSTVSTFSSGSILITLSYTASKLGHFLRHSV